MTSQRYLKQEKERGSNIRKIEFSNNVSFAVLELTLFNAHNDNTRKILGLMNKKDMKKLWHLVNDTLKEMK